MIILALLLTFISSKLIIRSPQSLADFFNQKYPSGDIPFTIANYGAVPYGKTITGTIGTPSYLTDCVFEEIPDITNTPILLL
jgi:hypothetical protein